MLVGMSSHLKITDVNIYTHGHLQEASEIHTASDDNVDELFCYQEASGILHQVHPTKSGFLIALGGMFHFHVFMILNRILHDIECK